MGEAKNRGAKEQRVASATVEVEKAASLIEKGDAPHYAFILDRSSTSANVLTQAKCGPKEIQARFSSEAFKVWEATGFEFVLIWGTWGYSGGLTIPSANIDVLLEKAIPAVVKRTLDKGGLCTFFPCTDPSLHEQILAKIAQLQPGSGPMH